jgi:hypothetical protein
MPQAPEMPKAEAHRESLAHQESVVARNSEAVRMAAVPRLHSETQAALLAGATAAQELRRSVNLARSRAY